MRTVPIALQAHLDSGATTCCFLLKIVPRNAAAFGVTSLDVDVDYNDGGGLITYQSANGLNLSAMEASAGLEVPNSEAMILLQSNFTKEDIAAGVLDYGRFFVYRINYANPEQGHILVQSGTTGIVKSHNILSAVIELRGLAQTAKQNFVDLYSLTCRAKFGSQAGDELFPCLFDAESLWSNGTVSALGEEPDREFTASIAPAATGPNGPLPFDVAVIEFLTGGNAGLTVETETVDGTDITLRFHSSYNLEVGDTYRIRPDCQKRYTDDCDTLFDNKENFRGEPWIPLTEEAPAQFPGAKVKGLGSPTNITFAVSP